MSKNLSEAAKQVAVAEIVRMGEKLMLPEGMSLEMAIDLLERRKEYEGEETVFDETYDVFPLDGAHALDAVLVKKFGWAPATATPGFFGKNPPKMMSVEVDPGLFKSVAWGRFALPNISGWIQTAVAMKDNRVSFRLIAAVLRKDETSVRSLFDELRKYLKDGGSIYKGKAIKLRFLDDDGKALDMPEPKFLDTSKIDPAGLIYAKDVQTAVEVNLFTPIRRVNDLIANGMKVKRGVLLGGTFGTGKTMAATVASRIATDTGVTYVYVPRANELAHAIEFAKQYQSPACVIFVEDVDRVTDGERTVEMDDILNIIDGIDTKNSNIITVLTTNSLDSINPAMLRPGRLDAVIEVTPPDAQAVEKLIRLYGGDAIAADADLREVGEILQGQIPAVIAEAVGRAKLAQIALQAPGTKVEQLTSEALCHAALSMQGQNDLLARRIEAEKAVAPGLVENLQSLIRDVLKGAPDEAAHKVEQLAEKIGYKL